MSSSRKISPICRRCSGLAVWLVRMDRIAAAVNRIPMTPSVTAGCPALVSGARLNSETASALTNASRAAAARTCWMTSGPEIRFCRGATEMATNSRPVRALAEVATATKRSR
jgi:hypothetical protein